jgi:hypothetical protein
MFDHIVGNTGVWAGLGYGATLAAGMTALTCYINGLRNTVAAVATRTFTASKDTYIDVLYSSTGTGTLVYTEVANNAASPVLAANSVRVAIIVSGATNIASAAQVNQGDPAAGFPNVSSNAIAVCDTLGNLIYPNDPQRKLLGMRQLTTAYNPGAASEVDILGLNLMPILVPNGRKVKISAYIPLYGASGLNKWCLKEGATRLQTQQSSLPGAGAIGLYAERIVPLSAGLHTLKATVSMNTSAGGLGVFADGTDWWAWIKAELE